MALIYTHIFETRYFPYSFSSVWKPREQLSPTSSLLTRPKKLLKSWLLAHQFSYRFASLANFFAHRKVFKHEFSEFSPAGWGWQLTEITLLVKYTIREENSWKKWTNILTQWGFGFNQSFQLHFFETWKWFCDEFISLCY